MLEKKQISTPIKIGFQVNVAIYEHAGKSCCVGQLSAVSILCGSTNLNLAEQLKV